MKTLYIECNMGVAGDMLSAALYELLSEEEKREYLSKMNSLGLPGVIVSAEKSVKCGITGTHMSVVINGEEERSEDADLSAENNAHGDGHHHHDHSDHDDGDEHDHDGGNHHDHGDHDDGDEHDHDGGNHHDHNDHDHEDKHAHHGEGHDHHDEHDHEHHHHHHHHTSMAEITSILEGLDLPADVKEKAASVYRRIAEAEGKVHGRTVEEIHFHEVGSLDAVADVVGVSLLMHMIAPEHIVVSPIHVGSGEVHCAHGILPVPAPATMEILSGAKIPFYSGKIRGELCTPTGAALIAAFADEYRDGIVLTVGKVGYGCGNKDFEAANVVRVMLGESREEDSVHELVCNLDDMTAEEIGFATEELMNAGALDVYTTNIGMKKNRPGIMLTCMCKDADKERMLALMFRLTTTLGVREYECRRYKLTRREEITSDYKGETVHRKVSEGYGTRTSKLEYEDAARIARKEGISLREARRLAEGGTL